MRERFKDETVELFLSNVESLWPSEIAACFGVEFDVAGKVQIRGGEPLAALVGGCVLISVALDLASSAAEGLKWNEYRDEEHPAAMKEFVKRYMPSAYQSIDWYRQFRSPLVHNFCPKGIELTHKPEYRLKHLKPVGVKGRSLRCVHVFQLLEDVAGALRKFAHAARADTDLRKRVKRYVGNHSVLEPRDP